MYQTKYANLKSNVGIEESEMNLPKRSECKCLCHTDANILGIINVPLHVMACCYDDIGENKMSAQELRLKSAAFSYDIIVEQSKTFNDCISIGRYTIDRNQAHLLYLFLKERFEETGRDDTFDDYPLEI